MVALIDVGTVGAPVNGAASTPLDVSTNDSFVTGLDEITASPGVTQAVSEGTDFIAPSSTPIQSACGGNACNLNGISDSFAAAMDSFSTSWSGGGNPAGSVSLGAADFVGVTNLAQLIDVLDTAVKNAGGQGVVDVFGQPTTLTVVGPFLSTLGTTTLTAIVGDPGSETTVDITGLTDFEASLLDRFSITIDGTPLDTSSVDFSSIGSRADLAAALDALPLISVTQSIANGGTLTITSETVGETPFTNIELVNITQAETGSTASFGFTPAEGGLNALNAAVQAAEDFTIKLNGVDVTFNLTAVSFNNAWALAGALNAHPDIIAQVVVDGSGAFIRLTAVDLGSGFTFSELELVDNQAGPPTNSTVNITGIDASAAEVDDFTLSINGAPVDTSVVNFALVTDGASLAAELDKIVGIDVAYSPASGGTLLITATTPGVMDFTNVSLAKFNEQVGDGNDNQLNADPSGTLLVGLDGDDTLTAGIGADSLDGGAGTDTADFSNSADGVIVRLSVGTGSGGDAQGDVLIDVENVIGSDHDDVLIGANNVDNHLLGEDGEDRIRGGSGNDTLEGGAGNDSLLGEEGDDSLKGGARHDTLEGGSGNDTLNGGNGDDLMQGGENADLLLGGDGEDTLEGGLGDDTLEGGEGADSLDGGDGVDTADYSDSAQGVTVRLSLGTGTGGDAQGDVLVDVENVIGSAFGDILIGANNVDNHLFGEDGEDRIRGGSGNDTLEGGAGNDSLLGEDGNDSLKGGARHDTLEGGSGNDTLNGGNGDDLMLGGNNADSLLGGDGEDTLDGGNGVDSYTGGDGADVFVFGSDGLTDTVLDYEHGVDLIDVNVPLNTLVATDIGAGVVEVTDGVNTIVLIDPTGLLVAADLGAADFI